MNATANINLAQRLVQGFSGIGSTEELVILVAGTDGMLAFCQELIDQYDRNTQLPLVQDVRTICSARGVLPGALFAEVRKVLLALNRHHDAGQDHYAMLGLKPDASVEEIKKAYRRLSKEYHPDRSRHPADDGKRFMEVAGAYHALMVGLGKPKPEGNGSWRKTIRHGPGTSSRRDRRLFLILIAVLVAALSGFSIYLSARYTRQAAISQLPSYSLALGKENPGTAAQAAQVALAAKGENIAAPPATNHPEAPPSPAAPAAAPPPLGEQAEANRAAADPAVIQPLQIAGNPQIPPGIGQESEPAGEIAKVPATGAAAPKPAQAVETARPVQAFSETAPPPAPVGREIGKVAAAPEKPAANRADSPSAEKTTKSPPAGTPAPEDRGNTEEISKSSMIQDVISHYEQHYNNRELASFLNLFAAGATENGHPVATLNEQYRSLFEHTRAITMRIHDADWDPYQAGFLIRGRFKAGYTYTDGRTREHNGDISFYLIDEHGELKIKALDYVFLQYFYGLVIMWLCG